MWDARRKGFTDVFAFGGVALAVHSEEDSEHLIFVQQHMLYPLDIDVDAVASMRPAFFISSALRLF